MILETGKQIDQNTGMIVEGEDTVMSSVLFYFVDRDTVIRVKDPAYEYAYAFYTTRWQEDYIYSYDYQKEQNWADYDKDLSTINKGYTQEESRFSREGYIRISIRRVDGSRISEEARDMEQILVLRPAEEKSVILMREDVQREVRQSIQTIQHYRTEDTPVFTLLTDSHMTVNGTWKDTVATIREVDDAIRPDGIIHLGDLEDGTLRKAYCKHYVDQVLQDMRGIHPKVYPAIGNHDTNYFRGNPDLLTEEEIYQYYLSDVEASGKVEHQLWYYDDYEKQKLRLYFLHSYDHHEKLRYGYAPEEIAWLMESLSTLPEDYRVIVFSHEAPIARLDYWASEVRNGEKLLEELEKWHNTHEKRIMAFIHGHTHADYIYEERAFPVISIGCSKCEYFTDKKPEGAVAYRRVRNTVTQELWDTLIVDPKENTLRFIRFGAGMDREIRDGKLVKVQDNLMEENLIQDKKNTKIWAHRGASGYAPENTLEAFQMAIEMGADGIELDVQFTKDRQLVVIHDETIDRVSDGHGRVVDYTLEELRHFTFNKTHPEYQGCRIPTLEEVLTLMKPTGMTVNIELKTGVNFYDGIEDRVLRLVDQLDMQEQVIYSSFNHYSVMKVKELCPDAHTGFLYCDGTLHMAEYAVKHQVEALHPSLPNTQYANLIPDCKSSGIKLHVWTVNRREDMERMVKYGVDAIITNYPDVAYEVIKGEKAPESQLKIRVEESGQRQEPQTQKEPEIQKAPEAQEKTVNKNPILHGLGVGYSKVRKVFVKIDQWVQRAAGR